METSRERQIIFIDSFGRNALQSGVSEMIAMQGYDWLTDEQIADIVRDKIRGWRRANKQAASNRKVQADRIRRLEREEREQVNPNAKAEGRAP